MPLLRFRLPACRALAVTALTALLAAGQALVAPQASGDVERDAKKDRDCSNSGVSLRYVIVFDEGTPRRQAAREIKRACGGLTMYYDAIAVAVATSADDEFGERIGPDRAFSAQAQRAGGTAPHQLIRPRSESAEVSGGDLADEQWDMEMINAAAARSVTATSDDVVVGVLDSGIDATHPDLSGTVDPDRSVGCLTGKPDRARRAWAPTTSVHGTHVAGTIAAADDGAGIVGVAPGVRLASIKVIDERGQVDPEAAVCGLMWAGRNRLPVTNSSFFVDAGASSCKSEDEYGVVREAVTRAADYATRSGTLNVAAATNEAVSLSPSTDGGAETCEALPASVQSVMAVSAVDREGVKAGYSSYGLGVISVAAPGGDGDDCVLSTVPDGYTDTCGTSMAAPHVAGVAALLASRDADAGPDQLRRTLQSTAQKTACPDDYDLSGDGHQDAFCTGYRAFNGFYGHGVVDALAAVQAMTGRAPAPAPRPSSSKKKAADPPRGGDDTDRGKADQDADVPDHGGFENTVRQLTKQLDAVVQGR